MTPSDQLRQLAREIDEDEITERAKLETLAAALEGGEFAPMWRAVSPLQALDVDWLGEQLAGRPASAAWITWIEWLRNALIFAPVLVTWWVISTAVAAYHSLLTARPDLAQVPFLYLWERSFEGQAVLPLSRLAFIDVAILIGLIVLTMASGYLRDIRVQQHDARVQEARHQVSTILSGATLALAESLPYGTADTMQRLDQVGTALLTDLREDRKRLGAIEKRQIEQADDLLEATVHLREAAGDLNGVARTLSDLAPRLDHYLATIAQTQTTVAQVQAQLQRDTNLLATTVVTVTGQLAAVSEQQQQRVSATLEALSAAAANIERASRNLDGVFQSVGAREQQLLGALETERVGQENLYGVFARALVEFEKALSEAATYSRALYGISVDVRDLAVGLPVVARDVGTEVRGAAASQRDAARVLADILARLEVASDGLDRGFDRGKQAGAEEWSSRDAPG